MSQAAGSSAKGLIAASGAAALAVALLAVVALAGWWMDYEGFRSLRPGLVAMNPLTAVAFLLAAASLRLQQVEPVPPERRIAARTCAALVGIIALLVLSRYLLAFDLEVDRILFRARLTRAGEAPNRMAPNTALCFLLLGAALAGLDLERPKGRWPAQALALLVALIGLTALLGYAYSSRPLYGVGPFIPMALNTALAFCLLAGGVLCARPARGAVARILSPGSGGVLARRLLPGTVLIPLVLGWLWLQGQQAGLYETGMGVALLVTLTIAAIASLAWRTAGLLDGADAGRRRVEDELRRAHAALEARVAERTAELRRTAGELRALVEASPLAICGLGPDGRVQSWNAAAQRIFGYAPEEVIGRPLPIVGPEQEAEFAELRRRVLGGRAFTELETRRRHKDGRLLDVSISTAPLYDEHGAPAGLVAVYADIGARLALEAQFRQSQKMEAVGRLAGGVAHDFNNVLTVIRAQTDLLLAELPPGDGRRGEILEIQGAADRAASFTRQLLAFSRRQILQPKATDLNAVITEMGGLLRRLVGEDVTVVTKLDPRLASVWADPGQLQQVIMNLAVNARDAMPGGGTLLLETANVELDADYPHTHPSAQSGRHVCLAVTDTGCGMDAATQARIFEPFFTTKEQGRGTGLGLSTVYGIVKQSGGHIWVYSEVGRGTTFKLYFPPHEGAPEPVAAGAAPPAAPLNGDATILRVEDEAPVRRSVRRLLERSGYRVLEARSGEEALALAAAPDTRIDLVLSDMVMPGMSGMELPARLRERRPGLRVLLMTGYTQEAISRAGAVGEPMIEKPFTLAGLLERVREVLDGHP